MSHGLFNKIKPLCTSLFKSSEPVAVLSALHQTLASAPASAFTPALIEYTFFPISHLLRKPSLSNQVLEQIFLCLSVLCTHWDLSQSSGIWTQLVILCNLAEGKDEETRVAACLTLRALFRPDLEHTPRNLPIIGKTLDTVLGYTLSPNHALQTTALRVLLRIVEAFPLDHVPAVLPGAVGLALNVLAKILERGIGDQVCIQSGAIRDYTSLDDLVAPLANDSTPDSGPPQRTPTWLAATSPQVHVSLLSLSPLSSSPNPLTRLALVELCTALAQTCARTLEPSQPLLVSHLLVLAYPALEHGSVPEDAQKALSSLKAVDVGVVTGIVSKALSLLPHRLSHAHQTTASSLAKQLVSACHALPFSAVGALLGPGGGIEKWGRTLLSVIRFESNERRIVPLLQQITSSGVEEEEVQLTLEGLDAQTTTHLASLFRALGKRAGDQGAFAIEWFVSAGVGGSVAGLWCALWLLRGLAQQTPSPRILKASKWIAKTVAEMWDDQFLPPPPPVVQEEKLEVVEYVKGLNPLTTLLDRPPPGPSKVKAKEEARVHSDLGIRLIVVCHVILAGSAPTISPSTNPTYASSIAVNPSITLLQYTIYPMLVQGQGLREVSSTLGYAQVENMLLANFDYALEAVARRVSVFGVYAAGAPNSTHFDPPRRISIVSRASDVIDECFDRLDDFHGYERVVGALVGVLAEVVGVVGREDDGSARDHEREEQDRDEWEFDLGKDKGKRKTRGNPNRTNLHHSQPLNPSQDKSSPGAPPHHRSAHTPRFSLVTHHPRLVAIYPQPDGGRGSMGRSRVHGLVERLVECVGEFMARRVWEDVWPRFEKMLSARADTTLVKRSGPVVTRGYESYGPRALADLHISMLRTLAKAVEHVEPSDQAVWSLLLLARRFLARRGGEWGEKREQVCGSAVEMYKAVGKRNPDVVWLVLEGMKGHEGLPAFLKWEGGDVLEGVEEVLKDLD
ncbi:hypothetical protein B0J17DRAFT_717401 [Rhizoctonia solani]|nr:hypothetical protein B0J17DRAFT_717401 [Rhizoctonia solani]